MANVVAGAWGPLALTPEFSMVRFAAAVALSISATFAHSQSLTPEEIAAMVEEKLNAPNPYAELLNNADQERGLAAMEIMLASGDPILVDMALEFGLLSVNPLVRQNAVEAFLRGKPGLTVQLDGTALESTRSFENYFRGDTSTLAPGPIGFWRLSVGEFDGKRGCFLHAESETCFVTVRSDGVVTNGKSWGGLLRLDESGNLTGNAQLSGISDNVPVVIRLLD